uniref:Uncharacterized protein n=1 Tax=Rhizophora mucronata TaxID=61149 RepID=A0A2P2QIG8_RHIMU
MILREMRWKTCHDLQQPASIK